MCHYITLIVPTDDTTALAAIMKRHGRGARAADNPSLTKVLRPGDRQYMTTLKHCDCGTVLGQKPNETVVATKATSEADRLRRKGWSQARITRALADKARAESRPPRPGPDSLDRWTAILADLATGLRLPHAGLFVHFYSGGIETDDLTVTRREIRKGEDHYAALGTMTEDELTVFRFTA